MSKATPIPGPYMVESDPVSVNALIYGKGRKKGQRKQLVAQVWSGDDCSLDVAIANANLLAASHDLLAALEKTLESLLAALGSTPLLDQHPEVVAARAAIKKAKGRMISA